MSEWKQRIHPGAPVVPRPRTYTLTNADERWVRRKLQLYPKDDTPMAIHSTVKGLLFTFLGAEEEWQERIFHPGDKKRWSSPALPKVCWRSTLLQSPTLYLVEGIFDAMAVAREGEASAAYLMTVPTVRQLEPLREDYTKVVLLPDGDVSFEDRRRLQEIVSLVWDEVEMRSLPRSEDPCSLQRERLKEILKEG